MQPRIQYAKVAPGAMTAMLGLETYVLHCGLERSLIELVKLRASQINGCAYCVDMHTKDARAEGETEQRLYARFAFWQRPIRRPSTITLATRKTFTSNAFVRRHNAAPRGHRFPTGLRERQSNKSSAILFTCSSSAWSLITYLPGTRSWSCARCSCRPRRVLNSSGITFSPPLT